MLAKSVMAKQIVDARQSVAFLHEEVKLQIKRFSVSTLSVLAILLMGYMQTSVRIRRGIHQAERKVYVSIFPVNLIGDVCDVTGAVDSTRSVARDDMDKADTVSDAFKFGQEIFTYNMDFDVAGVMVSCHDMLLDPKRSCLGQTFISRDVLRRSSEKTARSEVVEISLKQSAEEHGTNGKRKRASSSSSSSSSSQSNANLASNFKGVVFATIAVHIRALLPIDAYDEVVYPPHTTAKKFHT